MTHPSPHPDRSPLEHWEERYGAAPIWSGKVNATLADVAAAWTPGRSIDLGCGEGGDVLWLAEHGWDALGLDLSPTAIGRAREEAARRGAAITGRARFEAQDLSAWEPAPGSADLVTASFLHSDVALDRTGILRRAGSAVTAGGRLAILSHAAPPPWSAAVHEGHGPRMLGAAEELELLAPAEEDWEVEVAEDRSRPVTAPDGSPAALLDALIVLRRR